MVRTGQTWSQEEENTLKKLKLDPVKNSREKLQALVSHFKGPSPSVFGVTQAQIQGPDGKYYYCSPAFARKIKKLVQEGKLDWILGAYIPEGTTEGRIVDFEGHYQEIRDTLEKLAWNKKVLVAWERTGAEIYGNIMDGWAKLHSEPAQTTKVIGPQVFSLPTHVEADRGKAVRALAHFKQEYPEFSHLDKWEQLGEEDTENGILEKMSSLRSMRFCPECEYCWHFRHHLCKGNPSDVLTQDQRKGLFDIAFDHYMKDPNTLERPDEELAKTIVDAAKEMLQLLDIGEAVEIVRRAKDMAERSLQRQSGIGANKVGK